MPPTGLGIELDDRRFTTYELLLEDIDLDAKLSCQPKNGLGPATSLLADGRSFQFG